MKKLIFISIVILFIEAGCKWDKEEEKTIGTSTKADTMQSLSDPDTFSSLKTAASNIPVDSIVKFAETLTGIPYKYASADPAQGFDCSGFITYVFNHFNITVPRSSIDFTNVGSTIPLKNAKRGDLILFTGTDSTEKFVGHMGIVTSNNDDSLQFIHSTSGKAYGVTVTPLNDYYKGRFVKVIRIGSPL